MVLITDHQQLELELQNLIKTFLLFQFSQILYYSVSLLFIRLGSKLGSCGMLLLKQRFSLNKSHNLQQFQIIGKNALHKYVLLSPTQIIPKLILVSSFALIKF